LLFRKASARPFPARRNYLPEELNGGIRNERRAFFHDRAPTSADEPSRRNSPANYLRSMILAWLLHGDCTGARICARVPAVDGAFNVRVKAAAAAAKIHKTTRNKAALGSLRIF